MKYVNSKVVFQEIPDEITLCINISNCPCHCEGCHSSYLSEDIGEQLNWYAIQKLILDNNGISCIAFMGGDAFPNEVDFAASQIRKAFPFIKIAWYSGRQDLSKYINLKNFDYIKLGPYNKELGPLNSPTTNQRLYKIYHLTDQREVFTDITFKFWKEIKKEVKNENSSL